MIKKILILILMTSFVSAGIQICIDLHDPSPPKNLKISGEASNILLEWAPATDEPSCSGILKYIINREGEKIGEVNGNTLSYSDKNLSGTGEYVYTVFAVDKAGHNTGLAIKNSITIDIKTKSVGGGGSSSSSVCNENWNCFGWSECVGDMKRRICVDTDKCGTEKNKPSEFENCGEKDANNETIILKDEENKSQPGFFSLMTGAVIGTLGTAGTAFAGIFIIALAGSVAFIKFRKKKI